MPHTGAKRYAVVSCHVERPLDDECWRRFSRLQERRPGGFSVAALIRPVDPAAGEDEVEWIARARAASARGPLGLHTHFVSPVHARPPEGTSGHAERVRSEAEWMRAQELEPRVFCGGGWYIDAAVADTLAALGLADCTGTAFRPDYLDKGAARLEAAEPAQLVLDGGRRLLELPATHSLGMAARAAVGPLPQYVHVYFHDTDLLSRSRRLSLTATLAVLGRRCERGDLDALRRDAADAPELPFPSAWTGPP